MKAPRILRLSLTFEPGTFEEPCSGFRGLNVIDTCEGVLWKGRKYHERMSGQLDFIGSRSNSVSADPMAEDEEADQRRATGCETS